MQQRTEVMVGSSIWILLDIYLAFQQWKNFENPLRIDKVIAMSLVYYFFWTQCILLTSHQSIDAVGWREVNRIWKNLDDAGISEGFRLNLFWLIGKILMQWSCWEMVVCS